MSGFILKDIMASKQTIQLYSFIFVVIVGASFRFDMGGYAMFFVGLLTIFIALNSMTIDEKSSWNKYAISMPFGRSYIAASKYLLALLCLAGSCVVLCIGRMISVSLRESISLDFWLAVIAFVTLYVLIIIPVALKWGTEKARIIILLVFYIPAFAIFAITEMGYNVDYVVLIENYKMLIPVIIGVLTVLSVSISIRICATKDY